MKPAREWKAELAGVAARDDVQLVAGRGGDPTLKVGELLLHSRYDPKREACQLVESAQFEPGRPVLVIGLGLGYHALELVRRGFDVAVVEPDALVARYAVEGPMADSTILLGVGEPDAITGEEAFRAFARKMPQVLTHPPTSKRSGGFVDAITTELGRIALGGRHLSVAVVGPMFGGSLPITDYLARAFQSLGHRVLKVDNEVGWPLFQAVSAGVETARARDQLGAMVTNLLSEWSYARVAEFNPEFCVVLAQAPVARNFAARLAQQGIVSAYWFVENWRHMPYWKQVALEYDCFFHIQPGEFEQRLDEIGCRNHAFIQTGCDPEIHRAAKLTRVEKEIYGCDISFAGAGYYNRNRVFRGLTDYKFKIWGVNWTERELAPLLQRREERFTPDEFMKIVAGTKINLNLHASMHCEGIDPQSDAINPRVFEIAAAGGFQVCDPCVGLERLFDFETELPVYRSLAELREHIDYFLAHPEARRAFAERARARALKEHTYARRAEAMLDFMQSRHGARLLRRGVCAQRSIGEVRDRVGQDTEFGRYLGGLPADALFVPEVMRALVAQCAGRDTYPAQLFRYLFEVRDFADALLKETR